MDANLKVTPITVEEMLARPEQDYNASIWKRRVLDYAGMKNIQFYVTEKGNGYDYTRFWASYWTNDGLFLFSSFSAFSACLHNGGFCKVIIRPDGVVEKFMFKNAAGKEGYADNCAANRNQWHNTGLMVSTSI
jgi:hypothetical protein